MIPFLFIGGGLYFLFDALGNQRPSVDPADLGLPTKGFRGYRKGGHYAMGGRTEPNDDICSACRGSGEGSTPDSICSICGGSGVIEADEDYDGYESDGYDDTDYEKEWGGLDNFKDGGKTDEKKFWANEGLREIIKEIVLKLYKFSPNQVDITYVNPISKEDFKKIRRSVRYNLKKEGGYFTVTDEELKQYLIQLGGEGDFKN